MKPVQLKEARLVAGWTQREAAARLGVSQPYYAQMENGSRRVPDELALAAVRKLRLSPVLLPLPPLAQQLLPADPEELARALGTLGYQGFARAAKPKFTANPGELIARALVHSNLEPRLMEALPWVLAKFPDLDWEWLAAQCRLLNLQNRLGFLVTLAVVLSNPATDARLRNALPRLETSRLAAEGTLCRDSMSQAERNWVRKHRPPAAAHWNLLTTLTAAQLTHAA